MQTQRERKVPSAPHWTLLSENHGHTSPFSHGLSTGATHSELELRISAAHASADTGPWSHAVGTLTLAAALETSRSHAES